MALICAALAAVGAAVIAVGVGIMFLPAGLIVAGLEAVTAAYVAAYLTKRPTEPVKRS